MTGPYQYVESAAVEAEAVPADSVVSRLMLDASEVRVTAFHFAPGQEMLEHTSSHAAIVYVLAGKGDITLADEHRPLKPGVTIYLSPNLSHSLRSADGLSFLLFLIK